MCFPYFFRRFFLVVAACLWALMASAQPPARQWQAPSDPSYEIAGYQGDVLIIHGTEDGLVKPEYSAKASNVYDHCELHLIFGAGHGFWKPEHREQYHTYVIDFLSRQLQPNRM